MNDKPPQNGANLGSPTIPKQILSAHGRARCQAMLGLLEDAVRTRGKRRRAIRNSLTVCGIVLVGSMIVLASRPNTRAGSGTITNTTPTAPIAKATSDSPRPNELPHTAPSNIPAIHQKSRRLVTYVVNDKNIVARLSAQLPTLRVELLNDEELLTQLRLAGLPAGIIHQGDKLRLAFHNAPPPERQLMSHATPDSDAASRKNLP